MVHVRKDGPEEGPAIVLVHGFLGSMHWFDRLVPLLSNDFRVIRTDLIGHGASSDTEGGHSPEQQGRVLKHVLEHLGVTGGTLLGHSLGADVAIAALEQGLIADDLVVVNEGPDYSTFNRNRINLLLRAPLIGPALYRILPTAAIHTAVATFFAPGFPVAGAFDAPLQPVWDVHKVKYRCFLASQVQKERYVADRPLDQRISALGIPTLVLFGERDQVYRSASSTLRYRAVANATVETVADAGHSPILESPEWTAETIRHFLLRAS
ncbi:alpha/beta fold hydrolase [Mycobacterium sp. AT1]|uniref:alpha/beta fold hydrolase n=1 Tax=Mycobacterium sp. AT1 TaxID=1961706 RepID=UPI0009C64DFB|nr:alpha/beta hydrolase [Mycobacterium sp. AT1]OPX13348.1 hypothetical protein B1790_01115 [Mycobacterium sp. AT1]